MLSSPPLQPLPWQKGVAKPLYPIFTSSPIATALKKPIFREKPSQHSNQPSETSSYPEHKGQHPLSLALNQTETSCLKLEAVESSSQAKVESSPPTHPAAATSTPCCERPSVDSPEEEDEDQTVFFTPELFEDEDSDSSPQEEVAGEWPPSLQSPALLPEEQAQGQASGADGQFAISVSEESAELSQGQREGIREQQQGEEGQQVDKKSRHSCHRLSRSRHKAPAAPTGN